MPCLLKKLTIQLHLFIMLKIVTLFFLYFLIYFRLSKVYKIYIAFIV